MTVAGRGMLQRNLEWLGGGDVHLQCPLHPQTLHKLHTAVAEQIMVSHEQGNMADGLTPHWLETKTNRDGPETAKDLKVLGCAA